MLNNIRRALGFHKNDSIQENDSVQTNNSKTSSTQTASGVSTDGTNEPKHGKPKIMVVDCNANISTQITQAGYNASHGTFGKPYKVPLSAQIHPVPRNIASLPNCSEQEILIVSTSSVDCVETQTETMPDIDVESVFLDAKHQIIDPRPLEMKNTQQIFDRNYYHGGIFVVLVSAISEFTYLYGTNTLYNGIHVTSREKYSEKSFLSELDGVRTDLILVKNLFCKTHQLRLCSIKL